MSLNSTGLATTIKTQIKANVSFANENDTSLQMFCDSLASAIVSHIQENLTVTVPIGSVIIAVVGNATGTPNPTTITCGVL